VPIGLPGVERQRGLERLGVGILRPLASLGQRGTGLFEGGERSSYLGQLDVDQPTDRAVGLHGDLLLGDPEAADPLHLATIRDPAHRTGRAATSTSRGRSPRRSPDASRG
jgi:hypothetical protein